MRLFRSTVTWLLFASLLPTPMVAQVDEIVQWGKNRALKKAHDEISRRIGESVGLGSPILVNQHSAFRRVDDLRDFYPTVLRPASLSELKKPLVPGDYSLHVRGYCTFALTHSPGTGLPYKLATLEGRQSKALAALLVRGTLRHVGAEELQYAAWFIEAGTPLREMRPQVQALIHHLIPEYEHGLEADFLTNIEQTYNKYRLVPEIPSLETLLLESEGGRYVLSVRRARQTLADETISAENLPDRLYEPQGDGLPRVLRPSKSPQSSPWAEIRPGVFARFTIEQGFAGENLFEFRISKNAIRTEKSPLLPQEGVRSSGFLPPGAGAVAIPVSLDEIFGLAEAAPEIATAVAVGSGAVLPAAIVVGGVLIAYSIATAAQPLTIVPVLAVSMQNSINPEALRRYLHKKDQKMLSGCSPGRLIAVPSTAYKGGTSFEQEYICPGSIVTVHWIIKNEKMVHEPHTRSGPPTGTGRD